MSRRRASTHQEIAQPRIQAGHDLYMSLTSPDFLRSPQAIEEISPTLFELADKVRSTLALRLY